MRWLQPIGNGPKTERLAFRGGDYLAGSRSGLCALYLNDTRTRIAGTRGFRPAFALCFRSPMAMVMRTAQGKRGPFPPQAKGKCQWPHAASRQRKRRGANSMHWRHANWEQSKKWSGWLFAAAITTMAPLTACLPSICISRARIAIGVWVSVPLLSCNPEP